MLVAGKGLSGGIYPAAACVISERAAGWLHEFGWGHVSTFGGSELGCHVALAVLDITTRPETVANVAHVIERYRDGLRELQAAEPWLVEIRQSGLVIGLRVDHPDGGVFLQQELYELGLWAIASGFDQSVLQFKPGLLLDDATRRRVAPAARGRAAPGEGRRPARAAPACQARALTPRSRASASTGAATTFVREGENVTYRVDHGGRAYALRIHRPGYQTAASVRSEIAWMEALQAAGVATPDVVRGVSGDVVEEADTPDGARLVALFGWVEGESLRAPRRALRCGSASAA